MKKPQRIKTYMAFLMLFVAILFDGAQFFLVFFDVIPGLGFALSAVASFLIDIFAAATFFLWFALLGVNYSGKTGAQRMLTMLVAFAVEAIPFIDDLLPGITFGVGTTIFLTWQEDGHWIARLGAPAAVVAAGVATGGVGAVAAEGAATAGTAEARAAANTAQKISAANQAREGAAAAKPGAQQTSPGPSRAQSASMPAAQQAHGVDPHGQPYTYPGPLPRERENENVEESFPDPA